MKLTKTTTHTITFSVEEFTSNEGGMDHRKSNSLPIETLEEAIDILRYTQAQDPTGDWIITVQVVTE